MRRTPSRSLSSSQLSRRSIALCLAALPLTVITARASPMLAVTRPAELGDDLFRARRKVSALVALVDAGQPVQAMWRRYSSTINLERGPTGRETRISGLSVARDLAAEISAAEDQLASGPAFPECDAALAEMIRRYRELVPVMNEAAAHFESGAHREDGGEKARALHQRLRVLVPAFLAARQSASQTLEAVRAVVETAELAAFERATGRDGRWFIRRSTVEARKVIATFPRAGGVIDTDALDAALGAYEAFVGEFEAFAAANPQAIGPFGRSPRGFALGIRRVQSRVMTFPADPKRWAPEIGDIEAPFRSLTTMADALLKPAA